MPPDGGGLLVEHLKTKRAALSNTWCRSRGLSREGMMNIDFPISDTVAGYVESCDLETRCATVRTSDNRTYRIRITPTTSARVLRNLGESYIDSTPTMLEGLSEKGRHLFAYGTFYPQSSDRPLLEAQWIVFAGMQPDSYRHEEQHWWTDQLRAIASSYLRWQFDHPKTEIDYRSYRTYLQLGGEKRGDYLQETDTISRLVYGFASAYLLTGEDAFLDAAERGTEYLRSHMRFYDADEDLTYWYHGIKVDGDRETKLLSSEFGDDYDSIPMYEQIYALAGPTQTYRITGDGRILNDIDRTIALFEKHYKDQALGGFFSHIDPITLDPRAESLGGNRARKNWNSVGDHAPAYLINLFLATGERRHADFLESTFDTIVKHFPDFDNSPFVQERFHEDWTPDTTWGWQQNRAVVGHNLKIAWNLMRMHSLRPKTEYADLAAHLAATMPAAGCDQQRGGWYDVVERAAAPESSHFRFTWHDRKAWWQQEQAILAYLILHGTLRDDEHLRRAREAASFYNAFFLDHDDGGIYFNTLANGLPYLLGNERLKGSHSMSGYHSMELCYLSAVYQNLLITRKPLRLHFKPYPDSFKQRLLRVAPDLLPPGSVSIQSCLIDGQPYHDFDPAELCVRLPSSEHRLRVEVELSPTQPDARA